MRKKILVLDATQRSSLAVVRSLGKQPLFEVISAGEQPSALAGCSKYSSQYHQYPSPQYQAAHFISWLKEFIQEHNIFAMLPITEISSQLILMHADEFKHCKIPFASLETVHSIANKWQLVQLAQEHQVPVPQSFYFANGADFELPADLDFPFVIKPCVSRIWHKGSWIDTSVHIANTNTELQALLSQKQYLKQHDFMLQEFIPGHGAGVFCLYKQGQELAFFAHQRLREKPPTGGVSVLSEACLPDAKLKSYTQKLLQAVQWHGVAMVEFRISEDGTPYLMEVNTRFWGSLQLAIDSGVDFPKLMAESLLLDIPVAPPTIKPGQQLRWLLGDLDHLYLKLKSTQYTSKEKLLSILRFLAPPRAKRKHEVNRLSDIKPAWFELKQYFGFKN